MLLGRATSKNPGVWQPYTRGQNPKNRYHFVQSTIDDFWEKWIQLYAPTLVIQRKWNVNTRNIRLGDVLTVADRNVLRRISTRNCQRSVPRHRWQSTACSSYVQELRVGNIGQKYYGVSDAVTVSRSVDPLALLVPVNYSKDEDDV